jgi:hypothetical protein
MHRRLAAWFACLLLVAGCANANDPSADDDGPGDASSTTVEPSASTTAPEEADDDEDVDEDSDREDGDADITGRDEVVDLFTGEGMDQALAECIADGAIDEFGLDTMNETRDMTAEEQAALEEIVTGCMVAGDFGGDEPVDPSDIDCSVIPDAAAQADCEDMKVEAEEMLDE